MKKWNQSADGRCLWVTWVSGYFFFLMWNSVIFSFQGAWKLVVIVQWSLWYLYFLANFWNWTFHFYLATNNSVLSVTPQLPQLWLGMEHLIIQFSLEVLVMKWNEIRFLHKSNHFDWLWWLLWITVVLTMKLNAKHSEWRPIIHRDSSNPHPMPCCWKSAVKVWNPPLL